MNFSKLWLDMNQEMKRCAELSAEAIIEKKFSEVYYWNAQKNALKMSKKILKDTVLKYNKAVRRMKMQRDSVRKSYANLLLEEGCSTMSNEFFRGQMSMANKFLNMIGENENGMYDEEK